MELSNVQKVKSLTARTLNVLLKKRFERMMPKESPLARAQMKKLHVYAGTEHGHEAQKPEVFDIAAMNPKNKR